LLSPPKKSRNLSIRGWRLPGGGYHERRWWLQLGLQDTAGVILVVRFLNNSAMIDSIV